MSVRLNRSISLENVTLITIYRPNMHKQTLISTLKDNHSIWNILWPKNALVTESANIYCTLLQYVCSDEAQFSPQWTSDSFSHAVGLFSQAVRVNSSRISSSPSSGLLRRHLYERQHHAMTVWNKAVLLRADFKPWRFCSKFSEINTLVIRVHNMSCMLTPAWTRTVWVFG